MVQECSVLYMVNPDPTAATTPTLFSKKGSKRVLRLSPSDNPFWFQVEQNPFGFHVELSVERVLPGTKKGSSKGSPMGTAEEPF